MGKKGRRTVKSDSLGDRMKSQYENRTRFMLPRRTYTIIRLDGKSFHTFTKGFNRPYDARITSWMDYTAIQLCREIQGVKFAYTQSDEISLLLTDFEGNTTDAWFDGNLQKVVSVAASLATAEFNFQRCALSEDQSLDGYALFDARAFTIPDSVEVANYFIWRQQDAVRNSVQMLAQSLYSHKELQNKNGSELQEMTFKKGKNWNDVSVRNKRGGLFLKVEEKAYLPPEFKEIIRAKWQDIECPHFTVEELSKYIPKVGLV